MDILRVNTYGDPRFSPAALRQHGCYLLDGRPAEALILSEDTARITGAADAALPELVAAFRFHAPHITRFVDGQGTVLLQLPPVTVFSVALTVSYTHLTLPTMAVV